ncbi:hypothetical protein ACEWY4_005595 [Coilia grayii]|uniref:F-box domain-containing protein n=1 Tax=Coilia grayii TaxID=363190 RepID=A0ABD1KIS2_9TELE
MNHAMNAFRLPEEIWMNVFKYLPKSDKMNVRSCCRHFKRLVDHRCLWKDETVVLRRLKSYNSNFWKTLRKRMLTSVVVINIHEKDWKHIVTNLPWLRSVTIDSSNVDSDVLTNLSRLKELKRLVIRTLPRYSGLAKKMALLPQLEHLSLCRVHNAVRSEILSAVSQLCNLTSLHYHEGHSPIPKQTFHDLLNGLPKLRHLSLRMWPNHGSLPDDYLNISRVVLDSSGLHHGNKGLTSLELLNYMDPMLSPVALDHLPFLQNLTVKYIRRVTEAGNKCHLRAWLKSLSHLTELTVNYGHPLSVYADVLPRKLKNMSLSGMMVESGAMVLAGSKVPDLLHLCYDPFVFNGHSCLEEISRFFTQLQSLKVRYYSVSERDLMGLGRMQQLRRLVILGARPDNCPISSELLAELQMQTEHRIQVVLAGDAREPAACSCDQY